MSGLAFVGSPDFVPPTTARRSSSGARRSRRGSAATSIDPRLSIIEEDHPSPPLPVLQPPPPLKTHHRPFSRRFLGEPPRYSSRNAPPTYSFLDITGPKGEKFEDLRNNKFIARRGGWRKLCIVGVLVLIILLGLIVGLAVGLSRKNSNSSAPASNATSPANDTAPTGPFPAGSYTFTTFLSTVSTNCTANPKSWTCEPAQTYAQSPSNAQAIFNWVITDSSPTAKNFSISSTNNPFSITFANTSLTLMDAGTANERYTFKANSVPKIVYPSNNIKCYFNETTFSGDLYTKKPKTYPSGTAAASSAAPAAASSTAASGSSGAAYSEWGFAVDAAQSIGGGVDVPECYNWVNGVDGSRVTDGYPEEPIGSFCSCAYANYQ